MFNWNDPGLFVLRVMFAKSVADAQVSIHVVLGSRKISAKDIPWPPSVNNRGFDDHQIGEGKQRGESRGIIDQFPVAVLTVTEQIPGVMKGMLDLGLEHLDLLGQSGQLVVREGLAPARPQGDKPLYRAALVLFPYLDALVARIAKCRGLFSMQQSYPRILSVTAARLC